MRLEAVILFLDGTSERLALKRPSKDLKLQYKVNNKKTTNRYIFRRENLFLEKWFWFFKRKRIYYEHGNPEPLSPSFKSNDVDIEEFNCILESSIIKDIAISTKDNKAMMSIGLILGLCGIVAIVLIAIFS